MLNPTAIALRHQLRDLPARDEVAAFYRERDGRPLWLRDGRVSPDGRNAMAQVARAADDGLDPLDYRLSDLSATVRAADNGGASADARAELAISRAFARYVIDLRHAPDRSRLIATDPSLAPRAETAGQVLQAVARADTLSEGLAEARRMNPIYAALRKSLADHRAAPRQARDGDARERLILANMDRLRSLPRDLGEQYVLVDAATQRLWFHDRGRVRGPMRVIVGRPEHATPLMSGVIRYLVFNPYWNVPPDLVRDRLARQALREGPSALDRRGFEALSDWTPGARRLDLAEIDWRAVADGRQTLRMRQRPGGGNMMGQVKFMLPNRLGIYLHDTPDRHLFAAGRRDFSAGCVRLEDAQALVGWIGASAAGHTTRPDQRHDLDRPIPVYILYLTAAPGPSGLEFRPDFYGRDRPPKAAPAVRVASRA